MNHALSPFAGLAALQLALRDHGVDDAVGDGDKGRPAIRVIVHRADDAFGAFVDARDQLEAGLRPPDLLPAGILIPS